MKIREARPEDAPALARVFFAAVREGAGLYTEAERAAWLPAPPEPVAFAARLARNAVVVAEASGAPVGFITLDAAGYIDLAHVLPGHQRRGVFRALYARLEVLARVEGMQRLSVHASLMAQPAFRAAGFAVIQHETVRRGGEVLARAEMEKYLR
jgi:putative acetyltransferase